MLLLASYACEEAPDPESEVSQPVVQELDDPIGMQEDEVAFTAADMDSLKALFPEGEELDGRWHFKLTWEQLLNETYRWMIIPTINMFTPFNLSMAFRMKPMKTIFLSWAEPEF